MYSLTVGSLFSGIGGLDLGLERAGMVIQWQCEIDPFCRRVLDKHWPGVPEYADIRELRGDRVEPVDLLCGGFPCQDISMAGRRAGLAGERSGLFYEFMRLAAEIRPRWILLENVPGLLSSNGGRDMGTVLGKLGELGYGYAYRVLDAQFFGVAQRRRRVFIVGCLGDGRSAAAVLFEPESCEGSPAPSRKTGEEVAGTLGGGSGKRGWCDDLDRAGAFVPTGFHWQMSASADPTATEESCPTIMKSQIPGVAYGFKHKQGAKAEGIGYAEEQSPTLCAEQVPAVMFPDPRRHDDRHRGELREKPCLNTTNNDLLMQGMAVRRLTPLECERLQGFPDGWTLLNEKTSDSPRYRACGNAVCVPVAEWIGRRILEVEACTP